MLFAYGGPLLIIIAFSVPNCCSDALPFSSTDYSNDTRLSLPVASPFEVVSGHVIAMVGYRTATYVERVTARSPEEVNISTIRPPSVSDVTETCLLIASSDESLFTVIWPTGWICTSDAQKLPKETGDWNRIRIILVGLRSGKGRLVLSSLETGTNESTVSDCDVTVVQRFRPPHEDPFFYVIASVQLISLCLLGLRVRTVSLKGSLKAIGAILVTLVCQLIIVPLLSVAGGVSFNLELHSVVCMMQVGCFLSNPLSIMFAVLQYADVELSMILNLLQTILCFGVVPMWFNVYELLLPGLLMPPGGPADSSWMVALTVPHRVYWYLLGSSLSVGIPLVVGLIVRRCCNCCCSTERRSLGPDPRHPLPPPGLSDMPPPPAHTQPTSPADRAVYPVCLLTAVVTSVVSSYRVWNVWNALTNVVDLILAATFLSVVSYVIGALGVVHTYGLQRAKSVGLAVSVTGATVLATAANGPTAGSVDATENGPDMSLTASSSVVFELVAIGFMTTLTIGHLLTWAASSSYRELHRHDCGPSRDGNAAVRPAPWMAAGFLYRSFAERIVRSMIKAGEITFRRHATATDGERPGELADANANGTATGKKLSSVNFHASVRSRDGASDTRSIGFCGNSSSFGGRVLVVACDSMRRTPHQSIDSVDDSSGFHPSTDVGGQQASSAAPTFAAGDDVTHEQRNTLGYGIFSRSLTQADAKTYYSSLSGRNQLDHQAVANSGDKIVDLTVRPISRMPEETASMIDENKDDEQQQHPVRLTTSSAAVVRDVSSNRVDAGGIAASGRNTSMALAIEKLFVPATSDDKGLPNSLQQSEAETTTNDSAVNGLHTIANDGSDVHRPSASDSFEGTEQKTPRSVTSTDAATNQAKLKSTKAEPSVVNCCFGCVPVCHSTSSGSSSSVSGSSASSSMDTNVAHC